MAPTNPELKAALERAGVEYDSKANKAELEKLVADNNVTVESADASDGGGAAITATPDTPPTVGVTAEEAEAKAKAEADAQKSGLTAQPDLERAEELGYIGNKADPIPNEAYSQETDPLRSPTAQEQRDAVIDAQREAAAA